jgi:hypothetical protein
MRITGAVVNHGFVHSLEFAMIRPGSTRARGLKGLRVEGFNDQRDVWKAM